MWPSSPTPSVSSPSSGKKTSQRVSTVRLCVFQYELLYSMDLFKKKKKRRQQTDVIICAGLVCRVITSVARAVLQGSLPGLLAALQNRGLWLHGHTDDAW